MKFSIIIPCKNDSSYLRACLKSIRKMNYSNYEVIVIPDEKINLKGIRVIPLKAGPAEKRDLGVKKAKGSIIAFIDDDAYPDKDWLNNCLKYFKKGFSVVGGPQITPKEDSFFQKLSGFTLSSRMVGGMRSRYEATSSPFEIDDWPSVNLLIKKFVFNKVGGFDSTYYPGEDTKLCLDIINAGYKMTYAPDVVVYHHRRPGLISHLKQINNYGFHRGYFVKKFPQTSFKIQYFLPSIFTLLFVIGFSSFFFSNFLFNLFVIGMLFYTSFSFIEGVRLSRNPFYGLLMPFYVFLTHFVYGVSFIKGVFSRGVLR